MDRAEIFKAEAKDVALLHARRKAFANGRGFILRKNLSPSAVASLEQAAQNFARSEPPAHLADTPVETQAFYAIQPDDAARWWSFGFADVAPRTDAHDHFESAEDIKEMIEMHLMEAADIGGEFQPPSA
jgi:hypothetical protein